MAELFASAENEEKANQIIRLYNQYLSRDPLQSGLDDWLATGQSIEEIEQGIANSAEASFVSKFIEGTGRVPDADEREYLLISQQGNQQVIDSFIDQVAEEEGYDPLASTVDDDTTADSTGDGVSAGSDIGDTTAGNEGGVDTGERLYDYAPPRETGGSQNLYWGNYSKQVTLDELETAYYAQDNARTREAFGSWDNYLAYMNERQDLIDSGQYKADWWDTGVALVDVEGLGREGGQDDRALEMDIMQEGARQGEIGYNEQADVFQSLYQKYTGESVVKYLDNGAKYEWNGSGFVMTQEAFGPHIGSMLGEALPGIVLSAGLAGPLTTVLQGAGISSSVAQAASQVIINSATQLAATGELDVKQALISGAIAYGGAELGAVLEGSAELDGVLGDLASTAQDTISKVQELVETGIPIADAAIQAGGISMLTQLVTTGNIDVKQAALAAVLAGGKEAFTQFNDFMGQRGVSSDSYMNDLAEMEAFQQAAIDADIKDPFLNPNYETVGDGSIVRNTVTNEVFSVTDNKSLGQFNELDSNSDGILDSNDLSFVEVTATKVDDPFMGYEISDNIIVTTDGTVLPKGSVLMGTRDGGYYSYDADGNRVDVTLQRYNEVFGGGKGELVWNSEGGTEGTINYENGELAYQKVEGQWQDAQGNIVDDPQLADELTLIAAKAIDEPLQSVTYYDQDGNPISYNYPSYNLKDSYESGQYSGTIFGKDGRRYEWDSTTGLYKYSPETADPSYTQDVWYDPSTGTEYVKVDDKITITKVDIENVIDPVETQQTQTQQQTTTTTQASATLNSQLASASSSQEAANAVNAASAAGLSSSQIAEIINQALSGGNISSEVSQAANTALQGITASGDVSDITKVTVGDVPQTQIGVDVAQTGVGQTSQPSELENAVNWIVENLPNNQNMTSAEINAALANAGFSSAVTSSTWNQNTGQQQAINTGGLGVTGKLSGLLTTAQSQIGDGTTVSTIPGGAGVDTISGGGGSDFPAKGTVLGQGCEGTDYVMRFADGQGGETVDRLPNYSYCQTDGTGDGPGDTPDGPPDGGKVPAAGTVLGQGCEGPDYVMRFADGKGGETVERISNYSYCTTGPGVTPNGQGPGDEPGDGPGDGPGAGPGLGGGLLLGATGGGQAPAVRSFTPEPYKGFRIQAPEMLPDIVGQQQDAVAQLMKAISTPYGTKPSGQQLNGLFDRILQDQEKAV